MGLLDELRQKAESIRGVQEKDLERLARYTSSADRVIEQQLDVVAAERLLKFLSESNLQFEQEDSHDEKGKVLRRFFRIPYMLRSELTFKGDYAGGVIRVICRNVEWFGTDEFTYDPEALAVRLLEEYVKF